MSTAREDDARAAWEAITRMFIGDENQQRFERIATTENMTVRQLHAVLDISPTDPVPMGHLARNWYCDASNVTAIIDGLEQRGLAERLAWPSDRRVKLVQLTTDGVALRERVTSRLGIPPAGIRDLNAAELKALRELLVKAAERYPWPFAADRSNDPVPEASVQS